MQHNLSIKYKIEFIRSLVSILSASKARRTLCDLELMFVPRSQAGIVGILCGIFIPKLIHERHGGSEDVGIVAGSTFLIKFSTCF